MRFSNRYEWLARAKRVQLPATEQALRILSTVDDRYPNLAEARYSEASVQAMCAYSRTGEELWLRLALHCSRRAARFERLNYRVST